MWKKEKKRKKKKKNVISNFAAKNPLNVHHSEVKDIHREREKKNLCKSECKNIIKTIKEKTVVHSQ